MQSLKAKSINAFAWDISGTLIRQGSSFIISIFLARLLEPSEFGLIGMAMVFISISQVFIDVGLTSALIQSQDNTKLTYSSVFYLNVAAGLLLTLIFYFSAPLIGEFYNEHQVSLLVQWLSLIFIANSLGLVQVAILRKQLKYRQLTVRIVVASTIGGVLGVLAAHSGYGVYSLVIQNLSTALIGTVLLWHTADWRPDLTFSFKEVKKLGGFSTYVFLDQFISGIFNRLDILLIGKIFSPSTLGFYTRALNLNELVTRYSSKSITQVFYPVLSSLQENTIGYNRIYFKVISLISFLSYGMAGVLYIIGQDIIVILFGSKWAPTIPIFNVLILAACITPINSMMINAFLSKGKSKENFIIGLFRKLVRVGPLVIAYYYGIYAFTIAVVATAYFLIIPNILLLEKYVNISWKPHFLKWIEGAIPLMLVVIASSYWHFNFTWSRILFACTFGVLYIIYSWILKSEGLLFIVDNVPVLKGRFNKV